MRDSLEDNPLAVAVLSFSKKYKSWSGTPTDLLLKLGKFTTPQVITSADWPQNESAMSKRLKALQSQLSGAGVDVVIGKRSKNRQISVTYTGRSS